MTRIRIEASTSQPFTSWLQRERRIVEHAVTEGVRGATEGLKLEMRQAIFAAGLGARLGNAIGAQVYPRNRPSLGAAGMVYPRGPGAERIIESFDRGVTIRPKNGARMLAIPTESTPRVSRGGRGGSRPMTPVEVEASFDQDLIAIPVKTGKGAVLLCVRAVKGRRVGTVRRATSRRLKAGRTRELIPMFVLVPYVRVRKRFDMPSIAARWAGRIPDLINRATPPG